MAFDAADATHRLPVIRYLLRETLGFEPTARMVAHAHVVEHGNGHETLCLGCIKGRARGRRALSLVTTKGDNDG